MTLVRLLKAFDSAERSLVVVNRTQPDPIRKMLADTFGEGEVGVFDRTTGEESDRDDRDEHDDRDTVETEDSGTVESVDSGTVESEDSGDFGDFGDTENPDWKERVETLVGDGGADVDVEGLVETAVGDAEGESVSNLVLLVDDGELVASSTLDELVEAILLVNSDLYITGTRDLAELDLPAVLTGLSDTVFTLQGYPESNRQKLLLISISRFIERAAYEAGSGTLRSSFQRLSRLDDEVGTREVYEKIVGRDVETHVYGVPDETPDDLGATVHGGRTRNYTDTWFVVFRPEDGAQPVAADDDLQRAMSGGIALLAVEVDDRVWKGVWTYDSDWIDRLDAMIQRDL